MQAYNILAIIQANPEIELSTIRKAIQELVLTTQQEPECLQFYVREDATEQGTFYLWESWLGKEGLTHHYEAQYTIDYFEAGYTQVSKIIELTEV